MNGLSNYLDKYVATQFIIVLMILLSASFMRIEMPFIVELIAIALLCGGSIAMLVSAMQLGSALTPVVTPRQNAQLVISGIYGMIRHPVYSGVTMLAFGWSLLWGSLLSLLFSFLLVIFFSFKMKKEEILLNLKYSEYANYKSKVRYKIIPFIF